MYFKNINIHSFDISGKRFYHSKYLKCPKFLDKKDFEEFKKIMQQSASKWAKDGGK